MLGKHSQKMSRYQYSTDFKDSQYFKTKVHSNKIPAKNFGFLRDRQAVAKEANKITIKPSLNEPVRFDQNKKLYSMV